MRRSDTTRLVAWREIAERLQGRTLRVMTVLTALLVVAGITLPALLRHGAGSTSIGLLGARAQALAPSLERAAAAERLAIRVVPFTSADAARSRLSRGALDVVITVGAAGASLEVERSVPAGIGALVRTTYAVATLRRVLAAAGVPAGVVARALAPAPLTTRALVRPEPQQAARAVAAIAVGLLMYLSLGIYGGGVAQGVAQEKTTRTAEVLLGAVAPRELLVGKVLGIGACGLGQLGVAALAGLVANAVVNSAVIPSSVWVLVPVFLVCFLAGFALYAFAFAAAGALVARQEEVQFVTMPFSIVLLIGYLLVYAAIGSPNATWLRVASFLPPLTATLTPVRIALGHIAWWELLVQALLMGLSIYWTARLAGRVYAAALVRGGPRVGWRAAAELALPARISGWGGARNSNP